MTTYETQMAAAARLIGERGKSYGSIDAGLTRTCDLFKTITGIQLSNRDAAMFLLCVKLSRSSEDPDKHDNYIDGINYLAFAAMANAQMNPPNPALNTTPPLKPLNIGERAVADALTGNAMKV